MTIQQSKLMQQSSVEAKVILICIILFLVYLITLSFILLVDNPSEYELLLTVLSDYITTITT